jgi:hypothetical protein
MVRTITLKSVHGEEAIRGLVVRTVRVLKNEHLARFGIPGSQRKDYRILLDGVMLQESATIETLEIPDGATLTVVLVSAAAI